MHENGKERDPGKRQAVKEERRKKAEGGIENNPVESCSCLKRSRGAVSEHDACEATSSNAEEYMEGVLKRP